MLNGLCTRLAQRLDVVSYMFCLFLRGVAVEEVWMDLAHVAGKTQIFSSESTEHTWKLIIAFSVCLQVINRIDFTSGAKSIHFTV